MRRTALCLLLMGCLASVAAAQTTWHVDDDAPGDPAPGDPLVSDPAEDGTPAHPFDAIQEALDLAVDGDRISLQPGVYRGAGNIQLRFAGKAVTLASVAGPETCTIDLQKTHIVLNDGETNATVVEGITFQNGLASSGGGALDCRGGRPTIRNCRFLNNQAGNGGAIYSGLTDTVIEGCYFEGNQAVDDSSGFGGAIRLRRARSIVRDCEFVGNAATEDGGALYYDASNDLATLERCSFFHNTATFGGAVNIVDGGIIRNGLFVGNTASFGGAIRVERQDSRRFALQLINATLVDNGPGAVRVPSAEVRASILWSDQDEPPIEFGTVDAAMILVSNSLVRGGLDGIRLAEDRENVISWMAGNLDSDPRFVSASDWRLQPDSPAIDAGDAYADAGSVDLLGQPRVAGCRTDMGCYEAPTAATDPADCDNDGVPDGCQIAADPNQDLNRNNVPDACDQPRVLYVDAAAAAGGDGSAEAPFQAIKPAIHAARDTDEVIVRDGTYAGDQNKNLSPGAKSVVIRSENGPAACTIELDGDGRGFLILGGADSGTVVQGFTITRGGAAGADGVRVIDDSSPLIADVVLAGSRAYLEGGVLRDSTVRNNLDGPGIDAYGTTLIQNCIIEDMVRDGGIRLHDDARLVDSLVQNNRYQGTLGFGGVFAEDRAVISNCQIIGNRAQRAAGVYLAQDAQLLDSVVRDNISGIEFGGPAGVYAIGSNALVARCRISGNTAPNDGRGGGVLLWGATLVDCLVDGNEAADGAGVLSRGGLIQRCRIESNRADRGGGVASIQDGALRIEDSLIHANRAVNGAGLRVDAPEARIDLVNCTVVNNEATGNRGGGTFVVTGEFSLRNTIMWGNLSGGEGAEAAIAADGLLAVHSSDLRGGQDAVFLADGAALTWGSFNVDRNPRFVDPNQADYRLLDDSPCANGGDPNASQSALDLALSDRVQQCRVDIGAYESAGFADCNGNGESDACDAETGFDTDCDRNRVPDACDTDPGDPDGDGRVAADCDGNQRPDACDPDCNGNGVPDICDTDPNDPDGDGQTVADCNGDRVPDSCQADCDGNGVPDDCDVDPGDPDGDGAVAADCDGNGLPDECDADCNGNGVPDDCDIDPADPDGDGVVLADCDGNGLPDDCQEDCDGNGVLDACDLDPNDPDGDGIVADDCDLNQVIDVCDLGTTRSKVVQSPGTSLFGDLSVRGDLATVTFPTLGRVDLFRYIDGRWTLEWTFEEDVVGYADTAAVHRDRVAVMASFMEFPDGQTQAAVWTYRHTGTAWEPEAVIRPTGLPFSKSKGGQIALEDDTLVFGPLFLERGDTIIYRRVSGSWVEETRFPTGTRNFSGSPVQLELQGDLLLVSDPSLDQSRGAADFYRRRDGDWRHEQRLVHPTAEAGDRFGAALALDGDQLIVGVPGEGEIGTAFPFFFDGLQWQVGSRIRPPASAKRLFARGIALSGRRAIFGSLDAFLLFSRVGQSWEYDDIVDQGTTDLHLQGNNLLLRLYGRIREITVVDDCDQDGVLDICQDGPDENANARFDGCDPDCNGNGIPDDLDIDPTDPDGDGFVSADCNANRVPDECDVAAGDPDGNGYAIADCNLNGIPDTCETDCDRNGLADECDIEAGGDADEDGLLDVCFVRGDLNGDGWVDVTDLAILLAEFGCPENCTADISGDGRTDISDLAILLAGYGH